LNSAWNTIACCKGKEKLAEFTAALQVYCSPSGREQKLQTCDLKFDCLTFQTVHEQEKQPFVTTWVLQNEGLILRNICSAYKQPKYY
jgi:hypothetical protein